MTRRLGFYALALTAILPLGCTSTSVPDDETAKNVTIETGMGTRTRTGALGAFRRGPAHLALATGAPLVPVHIDGAYAIFPAHSRLPRLGGGRLVVRFGEPLIPALADDTAEQERALTQTLRAAVVALGASP